ncbi:nuclear transport factor 2 family protein [Microcoleus sp. FACHB-1515]|uniref:nuclear transport factor 2 family protein n=1 Tax=Cyanophyceae TaxID=3028117 RepID=UPI001685CBF5|nr:nuclear transport factor 2 family protein [Microcoleus sp. FACHB-1515]MBD2091821.1 nuclear transport factor 2 family protein [Microcoleus sp. FACHB-1515]
MTTIAAALAANQAFYRAFEKKEIEAMRSIWSKGTGSLCIHPGSAALRGWEQIEISWQKIFRNTAYMEVEIEVISAEISGNLAYIVLTETVLQIVGGRRVQAATIATNIFELMGGEWFLIHHHGSPILR